jgi:hypothetical protein
MPGIDSSTKLLLHCDGADASTTFTDSEITPKTVTANGNAQIDTAQSKFGGASALFDGTGDYLSLANSADWDMGTGDFTIDFWIRRNGSQGVQTGIWGPATNAGTGWGVNFGDTGAGLGTTNGIVLFTRTGGGNTVRCNSAGVIISDATWTHIAVVRSGNTATIYYDGAAVQSASVTGITFDSAGTGAVIGRRLTDDNAQYFNGWIDEFRVSKGVARWTANFTPPTSAYSLDGVVVFRPWMRKPCKSRKRSFLKLINAVPKHRYVTPPQPSNLSWFQQNPIVRRKPMRGRVRFRTQYIHRRKFDITGLPPPSNLSWFQQNKTVRRKPMRPCKRFVIKFKLVKMPRAYVTPPRPSNLSWLRNSQFKGLKKARGRKRFRIMGRWQHLPRNVIGQFVPVTAYTPGGPGFQKWRLVKPKLERTRLVDGKLQK